MLVAIIQVHVKPEYIEAFRKATQTNASKSIQEPGIARFDVYQQSDEPTRFLLVEIYCTDDAPAKHRETSHYAIWRDTVAEMMAELRTRIIYNVVYPSLEE